jgi:glycosyltransferase involved in cell wall biosynthesis
MVEMAESQSPQAYAAALRRALDARADDYESHARRMARRFDWSVIVPQIRRVYDEALLDHSRC